MHSVLDIKPARDERLIRDRIIKGQNNKQEKLQTNGYKPSEL